MRFGFAVDVGTTNIEISMWNLNSGVILGKKISRNCLYLYGADVVSRILYAHYNGVELLQNKLIAQLKDEFSQMIREFFAGSCDDFVADRAVFTGNTVMLHFLSGLSVAGFEKAPFSPVSLFGEVVPAASALASLAKEVVLPPCIGAFLGADIVCAALGVEEMLTCASLEAENNATVGAVCEPIGGAEKPYIIIDIGTNTEIMLVDADGKRTACSAAAGPAFEGGGLSVEMKGSALVSELARMLDEGIMDETGFIGELSCSSDTSRDDQSSESGGTKRRTILSQQDVRQLQLAKGATAAAVETLLLSAGREAAGKTNAEKYVSAPENLPESQLFNIQKCFICGNFGNALDIDAVKKTGLLHAQLADSAVYAGNAALRGAELILLSKTAAFNRACEIAENTAVLQLADSAVFAEKYIKRMNFTVF